jgi:hypothetical protein
VNARRQFLAECAKAFAALVFIEACEQEKLLRPKGRLITPDFFGHMVQGEWVSDDGTLCCPVSVYFGLLRLWDSRAVWWKMENDPTALSANLNYAERVGADTILVFGEPPASALLAGKSKMPTKDAWLSFVRQIARERIRYVELWNEPAEGYWDGSPEELVEYCKLAYPILSATGKTVLSPSITLTTNGLAFAERFLAVGGGEWCDEISFHAYCEKPDDLIGMVSSLRELLKKHRVSRPLRNTEYNLTPFEPYQMAQSLLIQASLGVAGAVWNPETSEAANDYTDSTMQTVAQWLLGASVGELDIDNDVYRVTVTRDGTERVLSWRSDSFPTFGNLMARAA